MVMTVKDAIDSAKGTIWAVLAWVDKERREEIFRDLYKWLDMHYWRGNKLN